jgi:hypothetical protein
MLSHDRKTMVPYAAQCISAGTRMTGLILVSMDCLTQRAIDDILLALAWYADEGWQDRLVTIPL